MKPKKYVWVVEMLLDDDFEPTVGCALSRNDGRKELQNWEDCNPSDTFRLVKYVRESD